MYGVAITETSTSALDKVIEVIPKLVELSTTAFNAVLDNPILLLYFGVSMLGVGLGVFAMMKNTAKG